ncbi:MAG: sulfatase [Kofleriaceae bacterium]
MRRGARRRAALLLAILGVAGCRGRSGGRDAGTPESSPAAAAAAARQDAADVEPPDGSAPTAPDGSAPAAPPRVEHVAWRAVDQRAMAHLTVDGDVILDAGGYGFSRFTRFGAPVVRWRLAQARDGEAAAQAAPLASLDVELSAEQARAARAIVLRLHASAATKMALKLNGRKPRRKPIELAAGWQTIAQEVPPSWLVAGVNQLVLETQAPRREPAQLALAWLRVGASSDFASPLPAAKFEGRRLTLRAGAEVAWYLTVPEGAHLTAAVRAPCAVEVRAGTSDGGFVGGRLAGREGRVDLSSFAGKVVRLGLGASPDGAGAAGARCEAAVLEEPAITVHGPAPTAPSPGAPPRYIILWVLDATRADRIPIFTPGAPTQTPVFDELAKTSAVFRQYYVQGNESQTSHSSVWTAVYPAVHNVRTAGSGGVWRIGDDLPVIAEQMGKAGLAPIAVTGNGFINDSGGYTRGFSEFRNMMRERGVTNGVLYGEQIVSAALARLDAHRDEPTFLFFGTVDSHSPWIARKPWIDRYSLDSYRGPFEVYGDPVTLGFRRGKMGCSKVPADKDITRLRAIYDSTISYSDDLIGKFIAQLKIWNIWDQTMLVITADHGDELFEHKRCGHGGSLRETLVRVPLLIHYPAQFPAGFIDQGAEGVDLVPTMLDALGAPALDSAQGASLRPLAAGVGRAWTTPSYASQYEYAHAMRLGRWKIVVDRRGGAAVYDLVEDPWEDADRGATRPVELRMLTDHLGLFVGTRTRWQKASWGVVSNLTEEGARQLDGPTP